jgi:transcriptional regulator with XRE-family HTH domain
VIFLRAVQLRLNASEARRLRKKDWTLKEIGDHFGVSFQRVGQVLGRTGTRIQRARASQRRWSVDEAVRLRVNDGLTVAEIARRLGVSESAIGRGLRGRVPPKLPKVSGAAVRAIRCRYERGGVTQEELAAEYGIDQTTVSAIVLGKRRRA